MERGSGVVGDCSPLTTFVRTEVGAFREIVQRLTGPADHSPNSSSAPHEAAIGVSKVVGAKRPAIGTLSAAASGAASSLLERRQYNRNRPKLQIVKPPPGARSTGSSSAELHSFSTSPVVTPTSGLSMLSLVHGWDEGMVVLDRQEEEKAIKERRFYLHPSPRSRARASQPELLDLFPAVFPSPRSETDSGGC
ncbi:hypothetical protein SAY87_005907 [Trapa incisa]|uniref:VQ domain-containing protein n=2 Tax=Trapa TaxID=22665 RepID=A0AAN7KXU9_TRANT|nr:hypothetical protein SAY87_005907 [Trapa incisa]KAK4771955.1 hypothetical protein SAY86_013730 [Trapa natans]